MLLLAPATVPAELPMPFVGVVHPLPGSPSTKMVVAAGDEDEDEGMGDDDAAVIPPAEEESNFDDFDDEFDDDFEEDEDDPDWDHPEDGDAEPPPAKGAGKKK